MNSILENIQKIFSEDVDVHFNAAANELRGMALPRMMVKFYGIYRINGRILRHITKRYVIIDTESGNANPSIRTLQLLAAGMGMRLCLEFIPDAAAPFMKK